MSGLCSCGAELYSFTKAGNLMASRKNASRSSLVLKQCSSPTDNDLKSSNYAAIPDMALWEQWRWCGLHRYRDPLKWLLPGETFYTDTHFFFNVHNSWLYMTVSINNSSSLNISTLTYKLKLSYTLKICIYLTSAVHRWRNTFLSPISNTK